MTTRDTVVAAAAAAGSREEVGLASLAALSVPSSGFPGAAMGSRKGTRGERTSPARFGESEYLVVQSVKALLRKTSALPNH